MNPIVLRLTPAHRRLKDWRPGGRSNAGEQRVTGLNNLSRPSATARVVPSRPVPMMETSGFSFLFVSGIGIFNVLTLSQLRRESQSLFCQEVVEVAHNQGAKPVHHRLRVWI